MKLDAAFWSQFPRSFCFPDHCNCEQISDGFILQPFAVITSLPIILVGITIFFYNWKYKKNLTLSALIILTGIGSVLVHTSFIKIATFLDFSGIYLIFLWIFSKSMGNKIKRPLLLFLILSTICFLILIYFEQLRFYIGMGCGALGIYGFLKSLNFNFKHKINSALKLALAIFGISLIFLILDQNRLWCSPDSWIHGHSIWHLGVAASLYYFNKGLNELDSNL